jgi:hypothetical protein
MSAAKQAGRQGETEKGKQPAAQKKRAHTTSQATQTQPALLGADALLQLWEPFLLRTGARTWSVGRTIMLYNKENLKVGYEIYCLKHQEWTMLKRTSKTVKG